MASDTVQCDACHEDATHQLCDEHLDNDGRDRLEAIATAAAAYMQSKRVAVEARARHDRRVNHCTYGGLGPCPDCRASYDVLAGCRERRITARLALKRALKDTP